MSEEIISDPTITVAEVTSALNQRSEELAVINSVQEALSQKMDIQTIYDLVGDRIIKIFNAPSLVIRTFDHSTNTEVWHYSIENGERQYVEPRPLMWANQYITKTKKPIHINENYVESACSYGADGGVGFIVGKTPRSAVWVPMIIGDVVTGSVSLQDVNKEYAFSESDVRLLSTLVNSMSVALENARLFDETNRLLNETEQGKAELAVINSVQDALSRKMDMQAIYDLIGDRIRDMFNAQVVSINTFNLEEKTEKFEYMMEKGERYFPDPRTLGKLRLHLIDTKKKIIINTREEGISWFGSEVIPGTEPIKSAVFVPMMIDEKITGYITLQNIDIENAFSESDIRLLETVSNSMSIALENARLFDETNRLLKETEQSKAELAVINSVQEGLVREMDIQGIYNLVGDRIRELFNAQVVIIASFDHVNKLEIYNYHIEKGEVSLPKPRPFDKVRQHLITTGQNILINENVSKAVAEFGMRVVPGTEMPKSLLFMPMKVGDKVMGYVSLQNIDQENAFSFSDVRLLSTLSNSMSVALQNAKLFDETTRLLKETEQRKAELAVINSVQEGLAKELDMQGIYDLVGDRVQKLFNAQAVIISSFDLINKTEQFNYVFENGEKVKIDNRPINKLRQNIIDKRRTIYIETERQGQEEYGISAIANTQMPKSLLFVPLLAGSDIRGYVSLQNIDKEHAFTDSDIRLLETLSNSMSVALENARLFDETNRLLKETEQQKGELAVINSVQDGLAKALDMQSIYDLVGNRIRDLFDAQAVGIATFDHSLETENIHYLLEKGERYYPAPRAMNMLRKHLIETKEKVLINTNWEVVAGAFGVKSVPGTQQPKSALFVPLVIGDKVTGYVTLQNVDKENAFSNSDVRLLETLANTMGVALENARLFDETTRLLKETEQQKAELGVINSVQEGLAKELDIQAIYDLIGDRIRELFNAQGVTIVTFDHENATEHFKYVIEDGQRYNLAFRPYDKLRQHLIVTKQKIVINTNFEEAYAKFGIKTLPGTNPTKSAVFVPLIIGDKVNSYISLQNLEIENAFSESDVRLLETLANSMSVALENARLFDETNRLLKETEQRTAELAVINSVQEGLAKELDMQAIYELVGNKIQKVFNAQAVLICTFDHERGLEHFNYHIEKGEISYPDPRPYDKLRKTLIETREKIYINKHDETTAAKYSMKVVPGTELPKSLLFVPLLSGDKVKSYVSLQNIDEENAFSESDIRLLETLANSMSVALENARLFDETTRLLKETEQRTAELAVINSVQEGLAHELDMQGIYNLVGDRVQKLFNAQTVIIASFDQDKKMEHFHYNFEKGELFSSSPRELNKLRQRLIKEKHTIYIETEKSAKNDFDIIPIEGTEMPKSLLFVPLMAGSDIRGYVSLQNIDKENAFSESDVRLLETLANSMSVALENARLFDETNRLLKETEQRTAELAVINSVQEGLAQELDMQAIYDMVGDRIKKVFNAQSVMIATLEKEAGLEHFQYNYNLGGRFYPEPRPLDKLRQHLIKTKQKIVIDNKEECYVWFGDTALPGTKPLKSGVFVPLILGDKVTSYVSLQNMDEENAFNEADIRLLETLANSMSIALENARLFDETNRLLKETEQRTAELAVINSVQEGLAQELDMQAIYDLVGDRIRQVFNAQSVMIATLDKEVGIEYFQYNYGKDGRYYPEPRPYDKLRVHLIKTQQRILINNNIEESITKFGLSVIPGTELPKSILFVPLTAGGKVNSYVSLQNMDVENAFSDSDVRLLETLANSMSVALENARLFDETNRLLKETEQRTSELAVINGVQDGLAKELDMQGIYNLVGDRIQKLFHTHGVIIASLDLENKVEHFNYVFENGVKYELEPRPFNRLRQVLIDKKETIYIETEETARSNYGLTAIGETKMPKSLMFVPLLSGNNIKGYVSIQNVDKEHAFNQSDIRLLETLANSMSVAHENARLFVETTRLLAEAKQRATELSTVNSISKALASQLDTDELIQFVGEQMKDLFKANIVYLALLNPKTRIINFAYQYGEEMPSRIIGEGLTSKIILSGEPLLINEDLDEKAQKMGVQRMGASAASYLGVPIPVGDENIGVLSVQSTEHENQFNENDLRLLSTIAASVGVALNNATLFEDVKQAKMEAESASKAAEKANEAKSAFLSTVSHELRTPLTSVLGFAKIIRKRLDEKIFPLVNREEPKIEKVVNQINENLKVVISEGERLTHLINDVLDLAKIEAGKMEWNVEDVAMGEVAERAIAATSSLFEQKSLKLEKNIPDDLPAISGDRDKLIQVIINLISNSVKFTEKGSVTCKVYQKKKELIVEISDTGIGIAPEDHSAVFEQFKQVGGDTLTDKPKGTGLGLPICKEIVEHHGGRIWLESKQGKGSTFSFALPLTKTEPVAKQPVHLDKLLQQLKEQMANTSLQSLAKDSTILIVDDDDSIRSLLDQELSDAGYLIEQAVNGKDALERVRLHRPDLIILDIMMPEMNGFDVAAILKNDPQTMDIPIIILSIVQDKARGFRIGVDRYLTKPIDTVQLFAEVGTLLEQGKSKKKVMVVDEDSDAVNSLTAVLETKGYSVVKSNGKGLVEKAVSDQPDIIILNSMHSDKQEVIQTLRFEKGLENVLFLIYQ